MAGATVETTMQVAERIASAPAPLEERRELTGMLVTLAGMRLPPQALLDMVRRNPMINEWVRESGVVEVFIKEGLLRGIEQGLQQGIEQGRNQGLRKSARLILQGRFTTLDQALLAASDRADEATLEQVLLHAATDTLEELQVRLGLEQ
jgi:hypothetical protein